MKDWPWQVGNDAEDRLDHQVHVDRHLHVRTDRFAYQRAGKMAAYEFDVSVRTQYPLKVS